MLTYFLLGFLMYGFQRSSYDTIAFIIRFIQGLHKIMVGCWTTIIQGSCGAKQWKWLHWIPSLNIFLPPPNRCHPASIWLSLVPPHADDNVYGRRKNRNVSCDSRKTKSLTCVRRKFRNKLRMKPPHLNKLSRRFERFKENGSVCTRKSSGRPAVNRSTIFFILVGALTFRHRASSI